MNPAFTLSAEINEAAKHLDRLLPLNQVKRADVVEFRSRLKLLGKLALSLEREVQIHRLCEAGKLGRDLIERLSAEAAANLVLSNDGNVIRPNFGRKP